MERRIADSVADILLVELQDKLDGITLVRVETGVSFRYNEMRYNISVRLLETHSVSFMVGRIQHFFTS